MPRTCCSFIVLLAFSICAFAARGTPADRQQGTAAPRIVASAATVEKLPPQTTTASAAPGVKSQGRAAKKKPWVPPGFEQLTRPQTTLVDIYYGDAYLMSTLATFTPSTIKFEHPNQIVAHIPNLLEPNKVAQALGEELPTNSELVCLTKNETGCGTIDTNFVDVIFDENRFRADLFIAPQLLAVQPALKHKYLPPSSAGLSLLNVTSASVNGETGTNSNYNIGNATTLAYKETRLYSVSNITSSQHLTIDTLALQREIDGHQFQGGIFRSSPTNTIFITQADFEGISIGSSLNTRQDLDQSSGSSLQVFLDSRSRVDILKDGRLISTGVYPTGNQVINTSQLPSGAYNITLRIRDASGHVRQETRFYIKTSQLPPMDQPVYFLDLGELVKRRPGEVLAHGTGHRFARAGISKRITASFGGTLGMLRSQDGSLLETGIFKLGRQYDLRLNAGIGSDHSRGISLTSRARFGRTILDLTATKIWSRHPNSVTGTRLTQAALNLTIPMGRAMLNLSSRFNERDSGIDRNVGLDLEFPTYELGDRSFDSNLRVTKDNGELVVMLGFRLSLRSDHWQSELSSQAYHDAPVAAPQSNGTVNSIASTWNNRNQSLSHVNVTFRANQQRNNNTLENEVDVASNLGNADIQTVYSLDHHNLDYGANFSTSVVANKDTFALGGERQAQSAVVLNLKGNARDAWFNVRVNKMLRGNARVGKKTIIGLAPFGTYRVRLVPHGKSIVDFNDNAKAVTLYPGNVVTLNWQMTRVIVAFGRIVGANGKPVTNALIKGVLGLATTDDSGMFQAELRSNTKQLEVKTLTSSCKVKLPPYSGTKMMVMLGTLKCL